MKGKEMIDDSSVFKKFLYQVSYASSNKNSFEKS
jgi:hypothetical protein